MFVLLFGFSGLCSTCLVGYKYVLLAEPAFLFLMTSISNLDFSTLHITCSFRIGCLSSYGNLFLLQCLYLALLGLNLTVIWYQHQVVKLKAFSKFENTSEALESVTKIIESSTSKGLRKFLRSNCDGETLAVADSKLGNAIKDKLVCPCL